jgi:serine/threonine protein kinase
MVKPISLDMKIGEARHVGNGFWRDVWSIPEEITNQYRVLKTIRLEHEMTPRNFERHRRDAMAMERLSSSPLVVDIYAFCGNSGVFEFADGGDLSDTLWPKQQAKRVTNSLSKKKKLRIATQITSALAAVHNFDREGRASVAHADISLNQFIKINGRFKLNDFNRARFLRWNLKHDRMCTFHVGNNPGKNRSPEEYRYEGQTEKVCMV